MLRSSLRANAVSGSCHRTPFPPQTRQETNRVGDGSETPRPVPRHSEQGGGSGGGDGRAKPFPVPPHAIHRGGSGGGWRNPRSSSLIDGLMGRRSGPLPVPLHVEHSGRSCGGCDRLKPFPVPPHARHGGGTLGGSGAGTVPRPLQQTHLVGCSGRFSGAPNRLS